MTGHADAPRVVVEAVDDKRGLKAFLQVPYIVHHDDPTWVAPLLAMERRRLSLDTGAFFHFGEAQLFVAMRNGEPVGRISAQINHRHLATHADGAGHFGFFDCLDDQQAAHALVEAAAAWLRQRGCLRMVGPFNFSINEECGLQLDGFDTAPCVFMTQARPWTAGLLERESFVKDMDMFAYRCDPGKLGIEEKYLRVVDRIRSMKHISMRAPDMSRRDEELALLVEIFNDSWSGNWGFSPLTSQEVENLLGGFSRFIRGHFARFVMLHGVPVGVMGFLPNYNEAVQKYHGRLFPFNWARLLFALAMDRFRSGRVVILGIRKSLQTTPAGVAVITSLLDAVLSETSRKYDWIEMGWVLESNKPMMRLCELISGPPVKRYRIFGRPL